MRSKLKYLGLGAIFLLLLCCSYVHAQDYLDLLSFFNEQFIPVEEIKVNGNYITIDYRMKPIMGPEEFGEDILYIFGKITKEFPDSDTIRIECLVGEEILFEYEMSPKDVLDYVNGKIGDDAIMSRIRVTSIEESKSDYYNHILAQPAVQKVLSGQNLQFEGFNTTPVTVSRIVSGDIADVYQADADNRIHNVNWQTSGAFFVNYDPTAKTYDAQLSVEEPDMPLVLKVGTNEVSSITAGTNLIIDTRGMNLFPEDQVDLVVIGPDGQIKHDEVNNQQFTDITVDYLTSNYGDADNTLETAGWTIGSYFFWVKTDSEYACGLDAESNVKPLKILKGSITIKAGTASTVELDTVKLTVTGVADDPIKVESSPLSDNVLFKEGIDDTPTGANYHTNWFTGTIDADGIRRYAVEFNDTGTYTIKVTVTGGDREGDSDTVDITVLEKEMPLDLPAPIPSELEIAELYTSKSAYLKGENVKVCYHIKNVGTVDVDEYHVIYEISGVDGEKICWFILSPHRIAAGEKQNWCPTENWNIPSNAESGTHTVEATLIWGSKTVEKKTAFLVKQN